MSSPVVEAIMTGEESGTLTVIFHACEGGGFTAECIELPGCFSEGETQEEVETNIRLAMEACLSVLFEDCLARQKVGVDFGSINLRNVSKTESFTVRTPAFLQAPKYA